MPRLDCWPCASHSSSCRLRRSRNEHDADDRRLPVPRVHESKRQRVGVDSRSPDVVGSAGIVKRTFVDITEGGVLDVGADGEPGLFSLGGLKVRQVTSRRIRRRRARLRLPPICGRWFPRSARAATRCRFRHSLSSCRGLAATDRARISFSRPACRRTPTIIQRPAGSHPNIGNTRNQTIAARNASASTTREKKIA